MEQPPGFVVLGSIRAASISEKTLCMVSSNPRGHGLENSLRQFWSLVSIDIRQIIQ
jgi:hypothetical protein